MAISPGTDRSDQPSREVQPIVVPMGRRPGRGRRLDGRLRGLLVVGAVLTGVVAASLAIPHPQAVLGAGVSSSAPLPTTTATPVPASAGPTPAVAADGDLPAGGPGVDRPGTVQVVRVEPNGVLRVTEQAVPGPGAGDVLDLRLPSMTALGGQVAELAPVVSDLKASVDEVGVQPSPTADGPGWTLSVPDGTVVVRISYRLAGAAVRTSAAEHGSGALAVSLPLLGDALRRRGLPLTVHAPGPGILSLTCPSASLAEMLCGREEDGGWTATVPPQAATPAVLVQLKS